MIQVIPHSITKVSSLRVGDFVGGEIIEGPTSLPRLTWQLQLIRHHGGVGVIMGFNHQLTVTYKPEIVIGPRVGWYFCRGLLDNSEVFNRPAV